MHLKGATCEIRTDFEYKNIQLYRYLSTNTTTVIIPSYHLLYHKYLCYQYTHCHSVGEGESDVNKEQGNADKNF